MNEYTVDGILKREFSGKDNPYYWRVSQEIWKHVCKHVKDELKLAGQSKVGAAMPEGMTDEEARLAFKKNLLAMGANGTFDAAMAGKLIDVLDLKADRTVVADEIVSFKDAYPDYAAAIALSEKPMPEIKP